MKNILCALLAVVAAATMECPGAVPEDASGKFWTQDNGGGDLGPLVQAHRGSRGDYEHQRLVEHWHMADEPFSVRIQPARQLREEPHRAHSPAEDASPEQRNDQQRNSQKKRPAEPCASRQRAEKAQYGT